MDMLHFVYPFMSYGHVGGFPTFCYLRGALKFVEIV